MENFLLTAAFSVPLIPLFYFHREQRMKYFFLGLFTLAIAIVFEIWAVSNGFWEYSATPQAFGVGIFTWLAYFPWLIYVYAAGNQMKTWVGK